MIKTNDTEFHGYTIRTQKLSPFKSFIFHPKIKERRTFMEFAESQKDSVNKAKQWIEQYTENRPWTQKDGASVNFNTDFCTDVLEGERNFSFDIVNKDDELFLTVYDEHNEGMFNSYDATTVTRNENRSYHNFGSVKKAKELGLIPNARYMLHRMPEANKYKFVFHSLVHHKNDPLKMGEPGLTVAAW